MIYRFALQKRMRTKTTPKCVWKSIGVFKSKGWDLIRELETMEIYPKSPFPIPLLVLKNPNSVQWASWIWGISKSPVFSVGAFSNNKPFSAPNSEVLNLGFGKHWAHQLEFTLGFQV